MTIIEPISTNIKQIIKLDRDLLIIREDSHNFEGPSNVYCLDKSDVIWYSELPSEGDYYSNDLQIKAGDLTVSSWSGQTVKIDIETGKILQKTFTK